MYTLIVGSLVLSIFHAMIPSHWLPVLGISRSAGWTVQKTLWVTFLAGLAHVLSTVLAGIILAMVGVAISEYVTVFMSWIAPGLLILLGIFYIYQHYYHHHFHLHKQTTGWGVIASLALAMFLSPCFEIEGYFLAAGQYGIGFVLFLALLYGVSTIGGMLIWVWMALRGLQRLDWHALEHNAGLIAGVTLIISGVLLHF
jgi:putative Mn2+ efflux pump MntP